ncbi:M56 family metallopeptidase [Pseudonocardia xishanensis]|uniref:M56 family metallopeptidase n=1 Tax=Pseudonocardia xishanensis TaxID=630995 RepID=A0ABP8RGB3_9PSEU
MALAALGLLVLGVVLAEPVSRGFSRARWTRRDPVGALLVWQAIGLAGGLSLVGCGVVYGLSPLGDSLPAALGTLVREWNSGEWPARFDTVHVIAAAASLGVGARLVWVLGTMYLRTLRARRRHRDLLDVLATPWPDSPGTRVLDHPQPVAYCLPGRSSRLVVSAGVLEALEPEEVWAVLAHERSHLRERHDLVVLPFVAWGATAPFVRGMECAQVAVAELIEMRADDVAACKSEPHELVGALKTVGGSAPAAALSSFTDALEARIERISSHPRPLPRLAQAGIRLGAIALVAVPTGLLLL